MNEYVSLASALHIQNISIEILIAWNCVCKYTVRLRFNVLLFIWYDTIRDDTQHNIYYYVLTETERTNLYWRLNWTQPTKLSHIRCTVYYIREYMYTKPTVDRWYWNIYSTLFQYILVHQPAVSSVARKILLSSANVYNIIFANTIFHSLAAQLCTYILCTWTYIGFPFVSSYRCIEVYLVVPSSWFKYRLFLQLEIFSIFSIQVSAIVLRSVRE